MKIQKSYQNDNNKFYIIPTPIGNLDDITIRTLKTLEKLDVLYCEDTRVTIKLLKHYDLTIPLKTYNDYSFEKVSSKILDELNNGLNVGLVSDAGMPGISDPGFDIINYLKKENHDVVILPGPTAFVIPMVYSTFGGKYLFYGFLSKNKSQYKNELTTLLKKEENVIIYETPHRILKTLKEIEAQDNKRELLVARELTKLFEEYIQGTASEIIAHFEEFKPKGEFVLVINHYVEDFKEVDYISEIDNLINKGMTTKDAVKETALKFNLKKNKIYNEYIKEKEDASN